VARMVVKFKTERLPEVLLPVEIEIELDTSEIGKVGTYLDELLSLIREKFSSKMKSEEESAPSGQVS